MVAKSKEICKRLSFFNYNEIENTVKSNYHASQSENMITVDQTRANAIAIFSNNENSDNSVPSSQQTEKSNNDTSPERNYASGIRNLAKNMITLHDIIPETDLDEDDDDTCNTTFTQHINEKIENDSQCFSLDRNIHRFKDSSRRNALIMMTTKYKPPSIERILESMTLYGIPKYRSQKPFFGNKLDYAKQKESSNTNTLSFDVPIFKSSLEEITSIKLWRRMKVNEFHPSGANIKTYHIKRTLAGYNSLTIKPLVAPPSCKDIKNWIKAKRYLLEKNRDVKSCKQNKEKELNVQQSSINIVNERDELQQGTSSNSISNNSNIEESDSSIFRQNMLSRISNDTRKFEFTQNSDNLQISGESLNPSLKQALENPLLHKQNKMQQQLGVSYGQIECLSKGSYGNVSNENLQNARAITAVSLLF